MVIYYYPVIVKVSISNTLTKPKQNMRFHKQYIVFNTISLKMQNKIIYCCQSDNQLSLYPYSIRLYNAIDCVLPINEMQRLIIEKVLHSLSRIPNFKCD